MRFATYAAQGGQRLGLVTGEDIVDVTSVAADMLALVEGGEAALDRVRRAADGLARTPLDSVKLMAPFPRPRKNILCLGLNYREHVDEGARARGTEIADAPKHPVWFSKAVTSVC